MGKHLADDLIGSKALNTFCPCIPTDHTPAAIQHDDGIILDTIHEQTKTFFTRLDLSSLRADLLFNDVIGGLKLCCVLSDGTHLTHAAQAGTDKKNVFEAAPGRVLQ